MLEVISVVYLTSLILSAGLVAWQYQSVCRHLASPELRRLNDNLKTHSLFWSTAKSNFEVLSENSLQKDQHKTKQSLLLMGLLGFASLPGFLLLSLIIFSMRVLVKSRLEERVFASELTSQDQLKPDQVARLVDELKQGSF